MMVLRTHSMHSARGAARALLALAALLGVWALIALVTGGFRLQLPGFTLSSRNPVRPAVLAAIAAFVAWRFDRTWVEASVRAALPPLSGFTTRLLGPIAAAAVLIVGVTLGARAASGADESGYVSQSVLWLRGNLRIEQPFAGLMPWPDADATFSPLGYRAVPGHAIVPTYAPGLPLLMAGARLLSSCAPFYVVPICSGMLVLFTWLLGRRVFGATTGIAGAVMVAVSPVVLMLTLSPMTDVPVAAFWIASLFAADLATVRSAAAAGVLGGIAAVIRPNLAPLALFPLFLTMVHGGGVRAAFLRGVTLSAAVAPFAAFIGALHNYLYGSPFTSGYGDASSIFSLDNFSANVVLYPRWWWQAHGVIGWLFVIGVFRPRPVETRRRAYVLIAFAVSVWLLYVFYLPFDHWGYLRFMLSAAPIALLLSADAVAWIASRHGASVSAFAVALVTAVAVVRGIDVAHAHNLFVNAAGDQRYVDAGVYVDQLTPPKSVILTMQHSGSVRYYSGRPILRYDLLDPAWLDRALDALDRHGYSTYAVIEDWEEEILRKRFEGQASTRLFDAGPQAVRRSAGGELRFFVLRAAEPRHGGPPVRMPRTSRSDCPPASPRFATPAAD